MSMILRSSIVTGKGQSTVSVVQGDDVVEFEVGGIDFSADYDCCSLSIGDEDPRDAGANAMVYMTRETLTELRDLIDLALRTFNTGWAK